MKDKQVFEALQKLDNTELLLWYQYFNTNHKMFMNWQQVNELKDKLTAIEAEHNAKEHFGNMSKVNAILDYRYSQILDPDID